ncbi:MAG: alpha/beta fold hydrolase [Cypionkella sp.]|uniref:alpha/beta fold hydrolase n=1 Tax=Cypionkella sp. TaxID=2811411 RepID=UPI002ABC6B40|nr:alpha/beta fold hydrolase [Cypionkella sp.]MDZ4310669.1 alpha/beta fold hydrolase [Cypionkella sp.]
MLATTTYPATAADPNLPDVLIVHGLYGSARNWGVIARHLADRRAVHVVDMRNHGQSPRASSQSYPDMAGDLAEVVMSLGAPMDVLGHSMGGKAAMQLALTRPELVRKLVVADIAPVAYTHDQTQYIAAMRALDLNGLTSRSEADRRLSATVNDPALRAFFLQSLDLKAQPPVWRLNLDVLEDQMPLIVGWPGTTGRFEGHTLFLTGALSHYVKPEYRDAIRSLFSKSHFAKLPGAGHWLHAERPREFEQAVQVFLNA